SGGRGLRQPHLVDPWHLRRLRRLVRYETGDDVRRADGRRVSGSGEARGRRWPGGQAGVGVRRERWLRGSIAADGRRAGERSGFPSGAADAVEGAGEPAGEVEEQQRARLARLSHPGSEEEVVRLKLLRRDARMARAQDALERPDPHSGCGSGLQSATRGSMGTSADTVSCGLPMLPNSEQRTWSFTICTAIRGRMCWRSWSTSSQSPGDNRISRLRANEIVFHTAGNRGRSSALGKRSPRTRATSASRVSKLVSCSTFSGVASTGDVNAIWKRAIASSSSQE